MWELAVVSVIVLLSYGCCKKGDGCDGTSPVSADFVMEMDLYDIVVPVDTITEYVNVRFRALNEDLDEYAWYINDVLYSTEEVFQLTNFNPGFTYSVRLEVTSEPQTNCFPDDDGKDTKTRNLTSVLPEELPIWGVYEGTCSLFPADTFQMSIVFEPFNGAFINSAVINNIPDGSWCYDQTPQDALVPPYDYDLSPHHLYIYQAFDMPECYTGFGLDGLFTQDGSQINAVLSRIDTAQMVPEEFYYPRQHFTFHGKKIQ
ncbi:MAG: hypothetical protein JNM00_15130 [Flavobacteriales bacterium]|nr:hypothetical protein [Flavobacteriales bacterium]